MKRTLSLTLSVFMFVFGSVALLATASAGQSSDQKVTCPVSGESFKVSEAKGQSVYEGKTYYFCCPGCKTKFDQDPRAFAQKQAGAPAVYTCPMHPEIQSDKPGKCPKCGMNLVKKEAPASQEQAMTMPHQHGGEAMGAMECPMMGLAELKDVEVSSENLKDGALIRLTAKDAESVKKIQDMAAKIKEMHAKK